MILLIQIETVCAKNTELANILRSPWVFTIHEARLMTLHRPMYYNPYANLLEITAKRILERLGIQTSSFFVKLR